MTKPNTPSKPVAPKATLKPKRIPHNPAFLEWPTDVWGLTKDLKRAVIALSSRINGHADKKALLDATLVVALGHLESRFEHDAALRASRIKAAEDADAEATETDPAEPTLF